MASPTDRGFVVIDGNSDGTATVMVAAAVEHGKPVSVYAMYRNVPQVRIDSALKMAGDGTRRYTHQVAEVFPASDGGVYVRLPKRSLVP